MGWRGSTATENSENKSARGAPMNNRDAVTVAIIGAGEMGAAVGRRLRESGARVLTSVAGRSAESVARVRDAELEVVNDDDSLVHDADFVLSIVPPGVAVEVAERFRGPLGRARTKPVFVECNAISPATCRRIRDLLDATTFIDAGIIGGPPIAGTQDPAKGPRFYASGADAHLLTRLTGFDLDVAILDGPVGAASGLKLSYAGLTKGFTALCATMLGAAEREGLAEALRSELARSRPSFLARIDRAIPDMRPKAYRWVA
ncbi:MAG TPA: NAD(P)-binding domain-containing protein, partial [Candidatus Limnocylindrales bacterium]|nr:NAD(P)-binding domain-containing protein [Candidatus Limnocylindrales bacterium]